MKDRLCKGQGYLHRHHESQPSEFLPVPELQKLLNDKLGMEVQILDYVREDLHAIRSGKLVFPKDL